MALVKANFSNCFTGGGPSITKIFEIDNTATAYSDQTTENGVLFADARSLPCKKNEALIKVS